MRTYAQKQNQPQERASASLARSNTATPAPKYRVHPILQLQRTNGNQAVQRMLRTESEEFNAGSTSTASPRIGHDFSQVSIRPTGAGR